MNKTQQLQEKKLDKLQDLVTTLERLWMYDEAEELQEYLLNPRANASYILNQFEERFNDLLEKFEGDWTDCERDEEWNQRESDLKWLEKINEVEINYVGYKDVVKYDRCYLFYDNVLDRWMVRWEQWLWLSNIERDGGYNWQVSDSYIEKWKWVPEKLTRMPRTQDFTLSEYNRMLEKHWIDIDWQEVIDTTQNKVVTRNGKIYSTRINNCPDIETIKALIQDELDVFEYESEWERNTFKEAIEKEKGIIKESEFSEQKEKINKQDNELKLLKLKAEREAAELRKMIYH